MKLFRLIVIILTTLPAVANAQAVTIDQARKMYFSMSVEKCNSLKLAELFGNNKPVTPLLIAYKGAASAAAPECVSNPSAKISWFRKGKALLDEAIVSDPANFEIRFLRFATQDKSPGFLGYNDNLNEDKNFLIKNLSNGRSLIKDDKVFSMITGFLAKSRNLNHLEKKIVIEYSNNIK